MLLYLFLTLTLLLSGCSKETEKKEQLQKSEEAKVINVEIPPIVKDKCIMCHDVFKRKVGPSFVQVRDRYMGDPKAIEKISRSIKRGSQGKWGRVAMLPNDVTEEEANQIAEWIMSLK